VTMAVHTSANDLAFEDIESSEKRRCPSRAMQDSDTERERVPIARGIPNGRCRMHGGLPCAPVGRGRYAETKTTLSMTVRLPDTF